jgi:hypothetical protein
MEQEPYNTPELEFLCEQIIENSFYQPICLYKKIKKKRNKLLHHEVQGSIPAQGSIRDFFFFDFFIYERNGGRLVYPP